MANQVEYKVLAYADDIAVVIKDQQKALEVIKGEAKKFGALAGYHLNAGKTQVVCTGGIAFTDQRVVDGAIYLGIWITPTLDWLVELNLTPQRNKIRQELSRINNLQL